MAENKKKIFIVIPAYNEEKKISSVLKSLKKNYKNIVVVDDGSTDNTYNLALKNKVHVLKHIINRGQGAALKTGIDYALSKGADIIVTYDADGQFVPSDIKKIIKPLNKYDIVLGSRFLGKAINIRPLKKLVLKLGVIVVYLLYGIRITDSQSGLRAMTRNAAKKINISCDRMEHASEFFSEIMKHKLKYTEIPITVIYDDYSLKKGQKWTKSIELGIKMIFRRFFL